MIEANDVVPFRRLSPYSYKTAISMRPDERRLYEASIQEHS